MENRLHHAVFQDGIGLCFRSNLFAECGVNLSLDGFSWNVDRIRPFRKNQLYASGPQRGVI